MSLLFAASAFALPAASAFALPAASAFALPAASAFALPAASAFALPAASASPTVATAHRSQRHARRAEVASMGLFDALKGAFANEEFVADDRRVRASHILIKGEGDLEKVVELMQELGQRVQREPDRLAPIFAELARRESQCSSASSGGDLGLFGPGKMVQEFDTALFPAEDAPQPGAILGPVVTDFGCHLILVTKREQNRDQVEEKLARND